MTFKEKLEMEHSDKVATCYDGGCAGCPCDYEYEDGMPCHTRYIGCEDCWNREIPGTEPTSVAKEGQTFFNPDVDIQKLISEAIKLPNKCVSIFIGKDGTNISIFDSEGEES